MELPTVDGGRGPRFLRHTGTVAILESQAASSAPPDLRDKEAAAGADATLLVTTGDFDPGDAPATAATALTSRGIRAVIAPGFERSFYERCFTYGVLPAIVAADAVERLVARLTARPDIPVTVDLEARLIECDGLGAIPFEVDPRGRNKLLLGLSDIDEVTRYSDRTAELRDADRRRRPWLYGPG